MNVDISTLIDVAFLLLVIYMFPGLPGPTVPPATPVSSSLHPIAVEKHIDTPLPSPMPPSNQDVLQSSPPLPRITLTPSHASKGPAAVGIGITPKRPGTHKRKSVSFSLSSMDDIHQSSSASSDRSLPQRLRRPPTPWMKGPVSPSSLALLGLSAGLGMGGISPGGSPLNSPSLGLISAGYPSRVGNLGVQVDEPESFENDDPLVSPKVCSKERVDSMGIKKEWLMS